MVISTTSADRKDGSASAATRTLTASKFYQGWLLCKHSRQTRRCDKSRPGVQQSVQGYLRDVQGQQVLAACSDGLVHRDRAIETFDVKDQCVSQVRTKDVKFLLLVRAHASHVKNGIF